MDTNKLIQINTELIQCITHIEEYLEYRYDVSDKNEIQKKILSYIDDMTEKLENVNGIKNLIKNKYLC